jgi:hypothetical protein
VFVIRELEFSTTLCFPEFKAKYIDNVRSVRIEAEIQRKQGRDAGSSCSLTDSDRHDRQPADLEHRLTLSRLRLRRPRGASHLWYAQRTMFTKLGHKDATAKGRDLVLLSTWFINLQGSGTHHDTIPYSTAVPLFS